MVARIAAPRAWIVEDSPLDAAELARAAHGYEVRTFSDGASFLEAVGSDPPSVALVDRYLPDIDGLELCRALRRNYDATQLPVVVVSAAKDDDSVLEALDAGANDHVGKPYNPALLRARVDAAVHVASLRRELDGHARAAKVALNTSAVRSADLEDRLALEQHLIGIVGHDLRNPLLSIGLQMHQLRQGATPSNNVAQTVENALRRAQGIIDNVLGTAQVRLSGGLPSGGAGCGWTNGCLAAARRSRPASSVGAWKRSSASTAPRSSTTVGSRKRSRTSS